MPDRPQGQMDNTTCDFYKIVRAYWLINRAPTSLAMTVKVSETPGTSDVLSYRPGKIWSGDAIS